MSHTESETIMCSGEKRTKKSYKNYVEKRENRETSREGKQIHQKKWRGKNNGKANLEHPIYNDKDMTR